MDKNEELDIHHKKANYTKLIEAIAKMPKSDNKTILDQYVTWHQMQLGRNRMSYGSAFRSIQYASMMCDLFPKVNEVTQTQLEKWFSEQMRRNVLHRTSIGTLAEGKRKLSLGTVSKIANQVQKFFKFVKFLQKGKPLELFNSKKIGTPEVCEFLLVDNSQGKQYEKPKVTQEDVKRIIETLEATNNYRDELLATLVSFLNDSGCRFGEAVSLRTSDLKIEGGSLIVTLRESKTRTRTIALKLCKDRLAKWVGNRQGLVFCDKDGTQVSYANLRNRFREVLKELNLKWKDYSSFHFLRHLFAARAMAWDGDLLSYWMGWRLKNRMRERYSEFTYKACLAPYGKMLMEEKNPMLNERLSFLDVEEKDKDELMKELIREAVKAELRKGKN